MMREPGIHEKIFRMFKRNSGAGDDTNDPMAANSLQNDPEKREKHLNLIKRLMYYFGPYM